MEPIIKLTNINKSYKTGNEVTEALKNVEIEIQRGEFVAIMGPSGSGKSTLMHIIGLLDSPTSGSYVLNDKNVSKLKQRELARIRNQEIGFVFQQFNLLARTSVLDNVLLPTIYGALNDNVARAEALIEKVGLKDRRNHKSNQLSGGQVQRVAIARALVMDPSIILADEPTGNLDTKKSQEIMELFQKINKEEGATIVLITHEDEVAKYADRIIYIKDGEIIK